MLWNMIFNYIFEFFENKFKIQSRTTFVRILHAIFFEIGLFFLLIPILSYWLKITLKEAFAANFVIMLFFIFYTYFYNYYFDKIFGLPTTNN